MKWSRNHREGFFGESGMATIRLLLGICLLLAVTAIVPFATFSYDGNGQSSLAHDGSRESTADCDAISAFAVGENESGASGCVGFRATFGDSLAAKGTDFMAGRLGGELYDAGKLAQFEGYLGRRRVTLRVGDEFLPAGKAGGFNAAERTLSLRSNPTQYEVWHEMSHFRQFQKLDPEAYMSQTRQMKEQFVSTCWRTRLVAGTISISISNSTPLNIFLVQELEASDECPCHQIYRRVVYRHAGYAWTLAEVYRFG